jgi:hypothetical protein
LEPFSLSFSKSKKEETTMPTKKLIWALFGIFVISAWVLGSAKQAMAETLNYKSYTYGTKQEILPIGDVEGHVLISNVRRGFFVFENGDVATSYQVVQTEQTKGGGPVLMYTTLTFPDGSTIIIKNQGTVGGGSGVLRSEIIKGTGRFEGSKGTYTSKIKLIPPEKEEPGPKILGEGTINYTLPSK